MEITAITGTIGFQRRGTLQSTEKINRPPIKSGDTEGESRLNFGALSGRAETLSQVDANVGNFGDQLELFSALRSRIEESNNTTVEISLNINVIKANLGSLLATVLDQPVSLPQTSTISENSTSRDVNQRDANVNERYINALITVGIDDNGLFGNTNGVLTSTDVLDSINTLPATQRDGRQQLLNLLIGELGTPRDEATAIVNTLESQPFQTVA